MRIGRRFSNLAFVAAVITRWKMSERRMPTWYKLISLSLLLILPLASCQQRPPLDSYQRFVSVPDFGGIMALDTKTGQLCSTVLHETPKRLDAYTVPRCVDLYQ